MQEELLHLIWQQSLYDGQRMMSTDGQQIIVISPGMKNHDEGPDFSEAKIRIGNVELVGNVEIHVRASDWIKHRHANHPAYQHIILHIVYHQDVDKPLGHFPTLDISPYIAEEILDRYRWLIQSPKGIPCQSSLRQVSDILITSWQERLLIERWQQKMLIWDQLFDHEGKDYQSLLYLRLAHNFGFKINSAAMMSLAQTIPYSIIPKLSEQPLSLEAIFYGQARLLNADATDAYALALAQEYAFLSQKFKLTPSTFAFKWLRLRPANFPTIRISQFVQLLMKTPFLFHHITDKDITLKAIQELLDIHTSDYWLTHYQFGKESRYQTKSLGASSIDNIIINTIVPFLYFYGNKIGDDAYIEKAQELLISVAPEQNSITKLWKATPLPMKHAWHSQSLIQLYNEYCSRKQCLSCAIGLKILK